MVCVSSSLVPVLLLIRISVWQIAQRDYRIGRGKHCSLTKATYNAVGEKFRNLWGKEAGWAHSVLFTADLRVFAERLSTKVDAKDVKQEDKEIILIETQVKNETFTPISLKRELDDENISPIPLKKINVRQVKRRRRA